MPRSDQHELAKLPSLFHHFVEFQNEATSQTNGFGEFLRVHYQSKHRNDFEHQNEHKELPFLEHCVVHFFIGTTKVDWDFYPMSAEKWVLAPKNLTNKPIYQALKPQDTTSDTVKPPRA